MAYYLHRSAKDLENSHLDLKTAFDQANALDLTQKNTEAYATPGSVTAAAAGNSSGHLTTEAQYLMKLL